MVSVVVVSSGNSQVIEKTLRSLMSQTLEHKKFEIVLAIQGEQIPQRRHTQDIDGVQQKYLGLRLQIMYLSESSAAAELLYALTARYVVFVWEGDQLSSRYLEALSDEAAEDTVPLAQIVESSDFRTETPSARYHAALTKRLGSPYSVVGEVEPFLHEIPGRMIPRQHLTESLLALVLEEEALLFNVGLALKTKFEFSRFPAARDAKYYRVSSHRGDEASRLECYTSTLEGLLSLQKKSTNQSQQKLITGGISALLKVSGSHLSAASQQNLLNKIVISGSNASNHPKSALDKSVSTLAIVANFAPYAGTAGLVAAKRIIKKGSRVDLISSVMKSRKKQIEDLRLTEPLVREHFVVGPSDISTIDAEIITFINGGLETLESWLSRGAGYDQMYSRAMVPHSHFLAAAVKRKYPHIKWTAEFSDPLSLTVEGKRRRASFETSQVPEVFFGWGSAYQQQMLFEERRLSRLAELLAYFFADDLLFTNENQFRIMLEDAPIGCQDTISSKASISHHPTLPTRYYEMVTPEWKADHGTISIAYFGDFHSTRGMNEVVEALDQLTDRELHQFRLVIFTGSKRHHIHRQLPKRLSEILIIRSRLDYLEFLATLPRMDVLIVNDSTTNEYYSRNPYLPSKVSDYLGARTPIWAIVEPESVLSRMDFQYKSYLGDVSGATRVLKEIAWSRSETGGSA